MKDQLFVKKMHLPVFEAYRPESTIDEDRKHQQVCSYIIQYVKDNICNYIVN